MDAETRYRYDTDPEALEWARLKVRREIERMLDYERQDKANGENERAERWRFIAALLRRDFISGTGCCIGAFDERLPKYLCAREESMRIPPLTKTKRPRRTKKTEAEP